MTFFQACLAFIGAVILFVGFVWVYEKLRDEI
jgi:hypothetical protein